MRRRTHAESPLAIGRQKRQSRQSIDCEDPILTPPVSGGGPCPPRCPSATPTAGSSGWFGITYNITTALKKAEKRLQEQNQQLEAANAASGRANAMPT